MCGVVVGGEGGGGDGETDRPMFYVRVARQEDQVFCQLTDCGSRSGILVSRSRRPYPHLPVSGCEGDGEEK